MSGRMLDLPTLEPRHECATICGQSDTRCGKTQRPARWTAAIDLRKPLAAGQGGWAVQSHPLQRSDRSLGGARGSRQCCRADRGRAPPRTGPGEFQKPSSARPIQLNANTDPAIAATEARAVTALTKRMTKNPLRDGLTVLKKLSTMMALPGSRRRIRRVWLHGYIARHSMWKRCSATNAP